MTTLIYGFIKARAAGFWRETRGAAAAELAIWVTVLTIPIISVYDLGFYVFSSMQVNSAAQAAAAAAWHYCNTTTTLPAVKNCTSLNANMTTAAQGTALGSSVTINSPVEGYYCVNGTTLVQQTGSTTSTTNPTKGSSDCSATVTGDTDAPGDYIQVTTNYSYTPVFAGGGIIGFPGTAATVSRTAWMRLN